MDLIANICSFQTAATVNLMHALIVLASTAASCPAVTFAPTVDTPQSTTQRIEWKASELHREFIVALRETLPNGPRLQSAQRSVADPVLQLVPSNQSPLTKFQVTVTARCDGGGAAAPVSAVAVNDRRGLCPPPQRLAQVAGAQGLKVSWSATPEVTSYRLALLTLTDASTAWSEDTARPDALLPTLQRPALLQVRAVCGALASAPAHLLVNVAD